MENLINVIVELTIYLLLFNGFKSFAFFGLPLLDIKPIGLKPVEVVKRTKILLKKSGCHANNIKLIRQLKID